MKKLILIIYLIIISVFEMNAITYNSQNPYESPYGSTYNYIPFKSTSSNIQNMNYNTVRPLNPDGSVSIDYTTYKGVYSPRRSMYGNLDDADDGIGEMVPVGDPDIYIIVILTFIYLLFKLNKTIPNKI